MREALRKTLKTSVPTNEVPEDEQEVFDCLPQFEKLLRHKQFPPESWEDLTTPVAVEKEAAPAKKEEAEDNGAAAATTGEKKKKKKGSKKAAEEDIDALFAEFGVEEGKKKQQPKKWYEN